MAQGEQESTSSCVSPMVTVRKPDGSARLCIDFNAINAVTAPLPFYMPRVEEVLEGVGKSCVISKINLTKRYIRSLCIQMMSTKHCSFATRANSSSCACRSRSAMPRCYSRHSCRGCSGSSRVFVRPIWMI